MIYEYAGGDLRNSIVAPTISFAPGVGNLFFLAAAGIEIHDGRNQDGHEKSDGDGDGDGDNHGDGNGDEDKTYFLFRLGVAYDIHLGEKFGIVPQINLDFVNNEEVWVYGFGFTYGF